MTKLREPLTVEHVLSQVINKLEEDEVKNITNKSISHFRKCSDPDDKDHNLYLSDAIKLDILMQRKSFGTPLMDNFQLMLDDEINKINSFENVENTLIKRDEKLVSKIFQKKVIDCTSNITKQLKEIGIED